MQQSIYVKITYISKDRERWFDEHGPDLLCPHVKNGRNLFYGEIDIEPNKGTYVEVANWDKNVAYLEYPFELPYHPKENFLLEKDQSYYVEFTIYACINGFNLYPYIVYKAELIYDGEKVSLKPHIESGREKTVLTP